MKKDEYNVTVILTGRLLGLQKEAYYLQMFDYQSEGAKKLNVFIDKIAKLSNRNKGARIAKQLKEKPFELTIKQAYSIAKTAIRNQIEL